MISVHAYKTWQGETRVCIAHSAGSMPAENGMPGVRTTLLNEVEARELLKQLTEALVGEPDTRVEPVATNHPPCVDCDSRNHRTGSVFCAEANKEEADAD